MKTVNVVAAVIIKDHKIFATQRSYGEFSGGWEFPGGKIEPGEHPEEALKREIREELDAEINIKSLLDIVEYDYPTFHLSMKTYLCTLAGSHIKLLEHSDARWLETKELDSVSWLPADLSLIDRIRTESI